LGFSIGFEVLSDLQKIDTPDTATAADQIEREKFEFDRKIRLKEIELKEAELTRLALPGR
jgi:hypothetical protein